VDERGLGAGLPGSFEEVQSADCIRIEVIERNRGGSIVTRLGGGVYNGVGLDSTNEFEDAGSVTDIDLMMPEHAFGQIGHEPLLIPPGVALGAEKDRSLVVINAVNLETLLQGEVLANL
jgi:hypothetical protein